MHVHALVPPAGPSPDDWILEELYHDDQMFLLDRKTGKLFSVGTSNTFPRPAGGCMSAPVYCAACSSKGLRGMTLP